MFLRTWKHFQLIIKQLLNSALAINSITYKIMQIEKGVIHHQGSSFIQWLLSIIILIFSYWPTFPPDEMVNAL